MDDFGGYLCLASLIGFVFLIFYLIINASNQKYKRLEKAKKNYSISLKNLKASPEDADLRQKTLFYGREYARVAREGGKETLFDEVALMNDMNAVAGGIPSKRTKEKETSISDRLIELQKIKDQGFISEDEYNAKRLAILDEI